MGDNKSIDILTQQLQLLSDNEKKSIEYQHELQDKVSYLSEKLQNREEKLQKLTSKFEELKANFRRRLETNADLKYDKTMQIIRLLDIEESDLVTVENSGEDVNEESESSDDVQVSRRLKNELEEKIREIARLTQRLNELEKESLESREALTVEVADKHDEVMNFKQQITKLEDFSRQLTTQLQFKEDIIRELRKEMKLLKTKVESAPSKSPKKSHNNVSSTSQKVSWGDGAPSEVLEQVQAKNDSLLTSLLEIKTILTNEYSVLKEKIQELHNVWYHTTVREKATYNQYLAAGHAKVDDMLATLESYRERVFENNDQEKSIGPLYCTEILMKVIDGLSDLCMNKNKKILELEYVLQDAREKNDQVQESESEDKIRESRITREHFNEMEEFRVCTVEAQAATEDLREEIDAVMCNLKCRCQLFVDLCNSIEKIRNIIDRTKQNILTVINSVKTHKEEKIINNHTIKLRQEKLKDIKNEINEARSMFSTSTDYKECEFDIRNKSFDNIINEVGCIVNDLEVFIAKEDYSLTLLEELQHQVNKVDENLDKIQENTDRVLQENEIARKAIDEKTKKLDKLERELDCAHTKMQDTLENIISIDQQNECRNVHQSGMDDTLSLNNTNENSQQSTVEIDQLKNSLSSKDKLLEHKDEIIRIQKDSMEMTQGGYKDLRERLQSKIDAQVAVINQCVQEKMQLLEQNRLQNQTIRHLQDAVVEAKKNLNRQLPQKSLMDFGSGDELKSITPPVFNNGNVHDV